MCNTSPFHCNNSCTNTPHCYVILRCLSCMSCGDAGEHAQSNWQAAVEPKNTKIVICLELGTTNTSKRVAVWNIWKCRQPIQIGFTRKVKTGFCFGYSCCDSLLSLLPSLVCVCVCVYVCACVCVCVCVCVWIWRYNIYRTVILTLYMYLSI
jgi:hypothetical protein